MAAANYALISFEGDINPGDPTGLKLYLQETNEMYKETDMIDIFKFQIPKILYTPFSV